MLLPLPLSVGGAVALALAVGVAGVWVAVEGVVAVGPLAGWHNRQVSSRVTSMTDMQAQN